MSQALLRQERLDQRSMTVEPAPIRVSLSNDWIRGPAHMEVFIWRIVQTGGPVDLLGPIDVGGGPGLYFFEKHEAEAYAKKQGWVIED